MQFSKQALDDVQRYLASQAAYEGSLPFARSSFWTAFAASQDRGRALRNMREDIPKRIIDRNNWPEDHRGLTDGDERTRGRK
jgi:hypothetical protein